MRTNAAEQLIDPARTIELQVISDLHLDTHKDNGRAYVEAFPVRSEFLVVAGDICQYSSLVGLTGQHVKRLFKKFSRVFYVPGNHEYYGHTAVHKVIDGLREWMDRRGNVAMLGRRTERVWVNGGCIDINGCTLWTEPKHPYSEKTKKTCSDFTMIPGFEEGLAHWHEHDLGTLRFSGYDPIDLTDSVVITHHGPSFDSMHEKWAAHTAMNSLFFSRLDDFVADSKAQVWIHGHTHDPADYFIDKTRVVCNPAGYPGENTSREAMEGKLIEVKLNQKGY